MALYEGLKSSQDKPVERPLPPRAALPAREWTTLRHETRPSKAEPGFLDKMLGQGSQAKLQSTFSSRPAPSAPAPKAPTWTKAKLEAVGSAPSGVPKGKKGLGRALLAVMVLGFGLMRLHPWTRAKEEPALLRRATPAATAVGSEGGWAKDLASLFHASTDEEKAREEARAALAEKLKDQKEAARIAALPVNAASGEALALWQDGSGRWWQVNAKAELRPCSGPGAKDSLGLPELRGVAAEAEEHAGGKRLSLKLPKGLLKDLLPLEPSVASEVRAIQLEDPAQPALLTHDGTRCLLDAADWERRQRRLGLVLADLAAKKRRASLIDLRYEDTAVVRPAGRG